jgi:hypothetical protein
MFAFSFIVSPILSLSELLYWKYHRLGGLSNKHFLKFCRLERPTSRHQQIWYMLSHHQADNSKCYTNIKALADLVYALYFPYRASSCCVLTWQKGSSLKFFLRTLIPFLRAPPLLANHLSKALLPNNSMSGVRCQYKHSGKHKYSVHNNPLSSDWFYFFQQGEYYQGSVTPSTIVGNQFYCFCFHLPLRLFAEINRRVCIYFPILSYTHTLAYFMYVLCNLLFFTSQGILKIILY